MNKKLLQSVREYKKQSIITPLLVTLEVLMEVLIPLEMAKLLILALQKEISDILSKEDLSL